MVMLVREMCTVCSSRDTFGLEKAITFSVLVASRSC